MEPSEGIAQVRPWVRFWARSFDYLLLFCPLIIFVDFVAPVWRDFLWLNSLWIWTVATILWMPIEAWCLAKWQTTPGKTLLKVNVYSMTRRKITYRRAFHRSWRVWVEGMGCGVFIVSQVLQIISYVRLRRHRVTDWDGACKMAVDHQVIGGMRIFFALLLFLVLDGVGFGVTGQFSRMMVLMEDITLQF